MIENDFSYGGIVVLSNYVPIRFGRTEDRRGSDSGVQDDAEYMRVLYESNRVPCDIDSSLREEKSFHRQWHSYGI